MSTYKTVNNDYTITCDNGDGIFTVNAQTVFNGNVIYTVPSVTIAPFITVAANNTGNLYAMGLIAQTGPTTYAGLRYDSLLGSWQTSTDVYANGEPVGSYANIFSGNIGGANTQIQFNNGGQFTANANFTFDYANGQVYLKGTQAFGNSATPANVSNAVTVYSNAVGSGGTGLYITSASAADELVSKSKAIVFAIIF